ncbi:MAG: cytochrome c biosis protein transrane region [Actinoallomurus sp.]|nr:cytochrome c biosis protein transrane region [Actinoallomurus sp.]
MSTVTSGSLVLAFPVAAAAGLVSFLSPCVLPLVPGYLSYVTGMSGADLAMQRRGRLLLGVALFVLGFTVVFVSAGLAFGGFGALVQRHTTVLTRVLGAVTILLGLGFMGFIPGLQRTVKSSRLPAAGLAGAPLLGMLFGLGWTPCIGPTLAAVQAMAYNEASAARGALLSFAYCLGLGLPFLFTAVAYRRALGAFGFVKRHYQAVMRVGGGMLVAIGFLLVTGAWTDLTIKMQGWVSGFTTVI